MNPIQPRVVPGPMACPDVVQHRDPLPVSRDPLPQHRDPAPARPDAFPIIERR